MLHGFVPPSSSCDEKLHAQRRLASLWATGCLLHLTMSMHKALLCGEKALMLRQTGTLGRQEARGSRA